MALVLPAYLLCGGMSRRFGSDKARQLVAGREMILGVADVYRAHDMPVVAVAREQGAYADLGITTIADIVPSQGPIAGIVTAIDDWKRRRDGQEQDWILISACDWVGLQSTWIDTLAAAAVPGDQVVVFRSRFIETLFALYHVSVEEKLRTCLASGDLALHKVIQTLSCRELSMPSGWGSLVNANKPDDLESE